MIWAGINHPDNIAQTPEKSSRPNRLNLQILISSNHMWRWVIRILRVCIRRRQRKHTIQNA